MSSVTSSLYVSFPSPLSFPQLNTVLQYRELESHVGYAYPGRVIWTSSLEARDEFFSDLSDYQLRKTDHAYEGSKYQSDLLAWRLDSSNSTGARHLICHPGICHSGISSKLLFPLVEYLKVVAFYIVSFIAPRSKLEH